MGEVASSPAPPHPCPRPRLQKTCTQLRGGGGCSPWVPQTCTTTPLPNTHRSGERGLQAPAPGCQHAPRASVRPGLRPRPCGKLAATSLSSGPSGLCPPLLCDLRQPAPPLWASCSCPRPLPPTPVLSCSSPAMPLLLCSPAWGGCTCSTGRPLPPWGAGPGAASVSPPAPGVLESTATLCPLSGDEGWGL